MEGWAVASAVVLVCAWLVALACAPRQLLDPRTLLLLNTLSAFLCPLWVCQDPALADPRPFVLGASRRTVALCVLLPAYLALAAGHLGKLHPASARV